MLKFVQLVCWPMLHKLFSLPVIIHLACYQKLKSADFWLSYSKNKMWTQWQLQKGDEPMYQFQGLDTYFSFVCFFTAAGLNSIRNLQAQQA